jgi:hypothetical protein
MSSVSTKMYVNTSRMEKKEVKIIVEVMTFGKYSAV